MWKSSTCSPYIFLLVTIIAIIIVMIAHKSNPLHESFANPQTLPIYYINLDRNQDRRSALEAQAHHQSLQLTRSPALDGSFLDPKDSMGLLAKRNTLLPGQLGCALSHYRLLQNIYANGTPYAIILEDDVILPDHFANALQQLIKALHSLPTPWDIVFLGGCNLKGRLVTPHLLQPYDFDETHNLCAHAYLVRHDSIPKLLQTLTPLYRPIDSQWRDHYHQLQVYYHYPNLVNQNRAFRSTRRDIDGISQTNYWRQNDQRVKII